MSEIKNISIELFDPNPYQPETRIQVNDQVAEQYGKSILQHGLLQIPLARVSPKDPKRYQMGDGWLRVTGFKWLVKNGHKGFDTIPAEIRELSEEQMAHLVYEANGVRKDLNPIETAIYFQKYIDDFKVTEGKLAEKHNLSQGEVANTIRLLQLPKEVQYLVAQGTLPQTHARHLLRLNKMPEAQKKLMQEVIKENTPVSRLSNEVETRLWQASKCLNPDSSESYSRPTFDVKTCKDCEWIVEASYPWGSRKKEQRCLKPECWDKKEVAAVALKVKEVKADLEKSHKGEKIFTNKELSSDQRADLGDYTMKELDNPAECRKCDKVVLFKWDLKSSGKPEKVCTNPTCLRTKKAKKTRDVNKIKSGEDKELTAKLAQAFVHAPSPRSAMLVYARHHLPGISAQAKLDLAVLVPGLPKSANGHLDMDKLMAKVEEKPIDELLKLVVAAEFCQIRRQHSYEKFNTELSSDLKLDLATIDGSYDKYILKIKEWQEANCRGCTNSKEVLVGSGRECCDYTYNKKILSDGTCERGKAHKAKTDSKQASVAGVEGSETEEPTSSTPQSEREIVKGIPPDSPAAKAIHALHTNDSAAFDAAKRRELAKIPAGVRLDSEVPKDECDKCLLATEDHTIDMRFKIPGVVAANSSICNGQDTYLKVCVKDWQKMAPATQEAIVEVAEKAAAQLAQRRADGIQTITDAEGLLKVYCHPETLEEVEGINSASTLTEKKPRLAGLYKLDGKEYACVGSVSSGAEGIISCDCYLVLPFEEINKIPDGGGSYHGKKCTYRGKEYVLAGRKINFLPQPSVEVKLSDSLAKAVKTHGSEHVGKIIDAVGRMNKAKSAKPKTAIPKQAPKPTPAQTENETEPKTVRSPSPANVARTPPTQEKTSELSETRTNGKNKEKPSRAGKKIARGASHLIKDKSPAGAPAALDPADSK